MKGREATRLSQEAKLFAAKSQWHGTITLNGETITQRTIKGARRKDLDWATIYTNNSWPNQLICRVNGLPMFSKPIHHKGCVLLEITKPSLEVLTSNRDGLTYEAQNDLDNFLADIATNTRKAFKEPKRVEKVAYPGYLLTGFQVSQEVAADPIEVGESQETVLVARLAANSGSLTGTEEGEALTPKQIMTVFRPKFHIRNELEGKIPAYFRDPQQFSANSKRLISSWISLLVELAVLAKCDKPFSVGFCFDEDARGLHEHNGEESIIYVNPLSVSKQENRPRQLKSYWAFNAAGNYELLSLALHEMTHHLTDDDHSELYANRLTDLTTLAFQNRTRLTRHFSAPICWPS